MTDEPRPESKNQVAFHYIKGKNFSVMHVDGVIGGVTPQGLIHMAVYSERAAIPRTLVHEFDAKGNLSAKPIETVSKPGVVREMSADLIFSPILAKLIMEWLGEKIKEYEVLTKVEGSA